jgi:hypothetical protein
MFTCWGLESLMITVYRDSCANTFEILVDNKLLYKGTFIGNNITHQEVEELTYILSLGDYIEL